MIIVVMGVSGCGKSTIAALMAEKLGIAYIDADDLHPPENKQLMSSGIPLTDENRLPWLTRVRDYAAERAQNGQSCVIACSALKKSYRDVLSSAPAVCYLFLDGQKSLIQQRVHNRSGHFMPESLLDSQFEALEPPYGEANAVAISIEDTPDEIATTAIAELQQAGFF